MNRSLQLGYVAAGLSGAMGIVELVRVIVTRGETPGFLAPMMTTSVIVIALLLTSAVGLALHRSMGWLVGMLALLVSMGYGVMVLAGGSKIGAVYLFGGLAMFYCLGKSLPAYRRRLATA